MEAEKEAKAWVDLAVEVDLSSDGGREGELLLELVGKAEVEADGVETPGTIEAMGNGGGGTSIAHLKAHIIGACAVPECPDGGLPTA